MKQLILVLSLLATCVSAAGTTAPVTHASGFTLYLPAIMYRTNWVSPFGVHSARIDEPSNLAAAQEIGIGVVRHGTLSWRSIQPHAGAPYNWAAAAPLEATLRTLRQVGIDSALIVSDNPDWATLPRYSDGKPSSCAAVRDERHADFAAFLRAAVARYSQPEFGVRFYEIGNEPDIDPTLVGQHWGFGCWGDIRDPYYGGERYGRMLKVVYPAIKAADSKAQVLFGGLLLGTPHTSDPARGRPELFLEGALRAGAGPFFDILPYHSYPFYLNRSRVGQIDYDTNQRGGVWNPLGGAVRGKADLLRATLSRYGVSKRLWLNEVSLVCPNDTQKDFEVYTWCNTAAGPNESFYEAQADFLVRAFMRAVDHNIEHVTWYSLDDRWGYTALRAPASGTPTPTYRAYRQLVAQLGSLSYRGRADYGAGIEAYRFGSGQGETQVLLTSSGDLALPITVPSARFIAAYTRDGAPVQAAPVAGGVRLTVGFSPLYLVLAP